MIGAALRGNGTRCHVFPELYPCVLVISISSISTPTCRSETLGFSFYFPQCLTHEKQAWNSVAQESWSRRCVPTAGSLDKLDMPIHTVGLGPSSAHPSRALAQCGDGIARPASRPPRGRRTWPCRYGRRCLVTGTSRFRALCLAARNRKENTPAPHVPAGPGPSTATAAEITDFPVLEREPFPFRTGCFLFLQVPCRTVAPCVQPVTGTRTRASERTEGSRGLDSAAGKEQRSARRRFLQVTTEK